MGYRLQGQAIEHHLPRCRTHAARTVLLVMAYEAHDQDPRPTYFKGSDALAHALGKAVLGTATVAGRRAVERALAELVQLGVIRQEKATNRSRNRRWVLHLDQPR